MSDPFQYAHKANARATNVQRAKDEIARHKAEAQARMAEKLKPKFNDLPPYQPRDPFKWGLG